jgi:predicted transcriptional regulator
MAEADDRLRELVAEVAAAYFSNSHVAPSEIPTVVKQIASSLSAVSSAVSAEAPIAVHEPEVKKPTPGQIRKSITPEGLISFEDGRSYKTLRRHLANRSLTPDQYREKYGLPTDYPMTSPAYSAMRSEMAKTIGLGQKGGRQAKKA